MWVEMLKDVQYTRNGWGVKALQELPTSPQATNPSGGQERVEWQVNSTERGRDGNSEENYW